VSRCGRIFVLLAFVGGVIIIYRLLPGEENSIGYLTASLVGITGYYAYATWGQLKQQKASATSAIRPLVIATRLSKQGEIGAYAGEEGFNRIVHLVNVGSGHAHRVNISLSPPAEAYAIENGTQRKEGCIYVIHGVEMPKDSKRMWNNLGALCKKNKWHYMYAEYEDTDGNEYYTIQSGYNVKTGKMSDLKQYHRKHDSDPFWKSEERENWLDDIDLDLKIWAEEQKKIFELRKE